MVQLGPYYSISEWWIHLAIFWNFSEGGCPKLEFLWALILQHVNQNKWLRFKTNHGSHFCSNWTKTKRKQKQSGDYIQGIYGRDCICTGNWFGDFRSGWAKLARQGCTVVFLHEHQIKVNHYIFHPASFHLSPSRLIAAWQTLLKRHWPIGDKHLIRAVSLVTRNSLKK